MQRYLQVSILTMLFLASIFSTSIAQIPWTKDPNNPILSGGESGSWNEHVFWPNVLYNADSSRYEMWFTATANPPGTMPTRIGFATSLYGINWEMHSEPVLEPDEGKWDELLEEVRVIRENGQYKMWYVGYSPSNEVGAFGYATSPDGITWTKYPDNPVMKAGSASWQAGFLTSPHVLPFEGGYKMWYTGWSANYRVSDIGYATSPDGLTWTPDTLNNPVLTHGSIGSWDDGSLIMPRVLFIEEVSEYHMWYTGTRPNETPPVHIGWATSADGIHWNKYNAPTTTSTLYLDSDPVLESISGQWDGTYILPGTVMREGDSLLRMWYSGVRSPISTFLNRIGHATAPMEPTSIKNNDYKYIPKIFSLSQNYPNPFNPKTIINYELPTTLLVELSIYNLLGEKVATIVSETKGAGHHQIKWDAGSIASGIYIYRIQAGEFQDVKKMVLLR